MDYNSFKVYDLSYPMLQLWSVIEQVLETDFLVSATDQDKLPGNIKKVGHKVFLERRPERDCGDDTEGRGEIQASFIF